MHIKDQLVASACDGTPMPPEVHSFYDWLEVDGWDELISDIDQGFAVNLKWLERSYFSDGEMEAELGCSSEEITDQKRVEYAKLLIARAH